MNNATGNCEGLVLTTRRYKLRCYNNYDAPLRVLAPGYSPHRNNARYAVGQRGGDYYGVNGRLKRLQRKRAPIGQAL